jgi:hypothetical protein
MIDGEQGDENREPGSPGKDSEKAMDMVPGTFVLDGEEKLDGERGDENSEPGSGKNSEKAVGMEPGTIMLDG